VYADPSCETEVTEIGFDVGEDRKEFYLMSDEAGSFDVTVNDVASSLTMANARMTFIPPPRLEFSGGAVAFVGECSAENQIKVLRSDGTPMPIETSLRVLIETSASAINIYEASDATCVAPISEFLIPVGETMVNFRYKASAVDLFKLRASSEDDLLTPALGSIMAVNELGKIYNFGEVVLALGNLIPERMDTARLIGNDSSFSITLNGQTQEVPSSDVRYIFFFGRMDVQEINSPTLAATIVSFGGGSFGPVNVGGDINIGTNRIGLFKIPF